MLIVNFRNRLIIHRR